MCLTGFDGVSEMEASCARILTGQWAMAQPLKADAVHGSALTFPVIACNTCCSSSNHSSLAIC